MKPIIEHPWNVIPSEAKFIQNELRCKVILSDWDKNIDIITGIQCFDIKKTGLISASIVTFSLSSLEVIEKFSSFISSDFPYTPGLLAFRWGPCILKTLEKISVQPDLLIFGAHGYAHPRRIGLATHIGVLFDMPSIGVAKTRLWGKVEQPLWVSGSFSLVKDNNNDVIGALVRTKTGAEPLYISSGHKISLDTAISLVLRSCVHGRFPEPLRKAYWLVRNGSQKLKDLIR